MILQKPLDFRKVVDYVRTFNLNIYTTTMGGAISTGLRLSNKFNGDCIKFIKGLFDKFKYQFTFGTFDGTQEVKFCDIFGELSRQKPRKVELYFQPTTKIKLLPELIYKTNKPVFHVTSRSNLELIQKFGLLPKERNRGFIYPPTLHLMTRPTHMVSLDKAKNELVGIKSWKQDLIMFKVDPGNTQFLLDPSFREGIITYEKIDSSRLLLVEPRDYEFYFKLKPENIREIKL